MSANGKTNDLEWRMLPAARVREGDVIRHGGTYRVRSVIRRNGVTVVVGYRSTGRRWIRWPDPMPVPVLRSVAQWSREPEARTLKG